MAHVPNPPTAPRTGLWGLGFRMEIIALRFASMYEDTKNVWVIGKYLSWPFYFLSIYFNIARDKCWDADQELVFAITWVKGLVEGSTIADILERIWHEFAFLRWDPVGWIRAKIDQVSGELRFIRTDPYGWMRSRLYMALPVFYSLLGNSGWWIYSKLNERYPEIGSFIRDSWGYIRNKVLSIFSWSRSLDANPVQYVINLINGQTGWFWSFISNPRQFIIDKLLEQSYDIRLLLTNPKQWIKGQIASLLGMQVYEMDTFISSLIKRAFGVVLSNQGGMLDYVKEGLVNLILRFI